MFDHSKFFAVTLATGFVVASSVWSAAYVHRSKELRSINVTGSVERVVDSDTVKWSVTLSRLVPPVSQVDAGRRLNADRETFLAFLSEAGISPESISVQPLSLSENMTTIDFKTGQTGLTGYMANQVLVIESPDVVQVSTLAESATFVMAEKGVTLYTQNLEYYYGKLADLKLELLAEATRNARQRGEAILSGGGGKLGQVTSADAGVFQITAVNSADLSDYGTYDTSSLKKKVKAVVHATFSLD